MKAIQFYLLLFIALTPGFAAKAQTVDDIIGKYVDAVGGKDKLSQIKSVFVDATVSVMGMEGPASITLLVGKGYRSEVVIDNVKIIRVTTDKGGWTINPYAGASDPAPMPDSEYQSSKYQLMLGGTLINYKTEGFIAELLPKDGNNYPIKITAGKNVTTYYVDATSYLLNKTTTTVSAHGQTQVVTTTYSNYQKTDFGYLAAYKFDTDLGQIQLSYTVRSVAVNKDIAPGVFDMPAK